MNKEPVYYNKYTKINDVFERYLASNFDDQQMVNFLMSECANFLHSKGIEEYAFKHFIIEFEIKYDVKTKDQSYIGIMGGNLMSALWIINVFPPNPEKYIFENTCIFENKKYIYDPTNKSLKINRAWTKKSQK